MPNTPIPIPDEQLYSKEIAERVMLIGNMRKTPNLLYGMFTELIRQFYSESRNLPIDVSHTWSKDVTKTKLWIDAEYVWEDENPEKRPAIYIKLSELTYKSQTGRHDGLSGFDLQEGEFHFSRNGFGSVTWVHVAKRAGEALVLAGSTLDFLDAFAMVIRDDFCFETFELASCKPLTPRDNDEVKERDASLVTCSFSFQDNWRLKLESPKLKRVVFETGQALLDALE